MQHVGKLGFVCSKSSRLHPERGEHRLRWWFLSRYYLHTLFSYPIQMWRRTLCILRIRRLCVMKTTEESFVLSLLRCPCSLLLSFRPLPPHRIHHHHCRRRRRLHLHLHRLRRLRCRDVVSAERGLRRTEQWFSGEPRLGESNP